MLSFKPKNKGFSLLELIIAVAILSVGITVVLRAMAFSARVTGLSCDMVIAGFLAEDKLQELEFKENKNLVQEETIKEKKDKFDCDYTIAKNPGNNLFDLNLSIKWERLNRKEDLSLNTYLRE